MSKSLSESIQQSKPFSSVRAEVYLNIVRTHSILATRHDRLFKSHGITSVQYNVLRILRGAGAEGLRTHDISARMVTRVPDISRLIDRMVNLDFVTRHPCEDDKRAVYIKMTSQAKKLLTKLDQPIVDLTDEMFANMSPEILETFNDLLVEARQGE